MEAPIETEEAASNESSNDFVSKFRAAAVENLYADNDQRQSPNRDQIIAKIRALLATNKEILDRCMDSKVDSSDNAFSSRILSGPFGWTFKRTNYSTVKVRTVDGIVEFYSDPYVECNTFDATSLYQLPPRLRDFSFYKKDTLFETKVIDFSAYLEGCVLLNDEVLLPLLVLLKEHLETVQVSLGDIEQWIVAADESLSFLESAFGSFEVNLDCAPGGLKSIVMKSVPISGNLKFSFDVSCESRRAKLIHCIDFVESIKAPSCFHSEWIKALPTFHVGSA